jgi:pentatricopeptide repeat protein
MDMYLKCDLLAEAENVFKTLPKDDIVSWNTAIFGYADCGCGEAAWHNFEEMGKSRVSEDATSYIGVLKACTVMTALEKGKLRHEDVVMKGLEGDVFVGSALIGMYSKCAALREAREVLEKLPIRNVVVWNTMVKGCCLNHDWEMAVRCFQAMGDEGVRPDATTFTCLISAFGRTSLVNEGQVFFENMERIHGILPNSNHFSCMVDLFARSGKLPEAENLLQTMPCHPARDARRALLTACKTFESFKMGERCHVQLAY